MFTSYTHHCNDWNVLIFEYRIIDHVAGTVVLAKKNPQKLFDVLALVLL